MYVVPLLCQNAHWCHFGSCQQIRISDHTVWTSPQWSNCQHHIDALVRQVHKSGYLPGPEYSGLLGASPSCLKFAIKNLTMACVSSSSSGILAAVPDGEPSCVSSPSSTVFSCGATDIWRPELVLVISVWALGLPLMPGMLNELYTNHKPCSHKKLDNVCQTVTSPVIRMNALITDDAEFSTVQSHSQRLTNTKLDCKSFFQVYQSLYIAKYISQGASLQMFLSEDKNKNDRTTTLDHPAQYNTECPREQSRQALHQTDIFWRRAQSDTECDHS